MIYIYFIEFDLESLKIDIDDQQEGELKDKIHQKLFVKIESILNGNYNNEIHDELFKFKTDLRHRISNKTVVEVIIDKIEEDEMDIIAIKDDSHHT